MCRFILFLLSITHLKEQILKGGEFFTSTNFYCRVPALGAHTYLLFGGTIPQSGEAQKKTKKKAVPIKVDVKTKQNKNGLLNTNLVETFVESTTQLFSE